MRGRLETARDGALHEIAPGDNLAAVRIDASLFARIGIGELPIGAGLLAAVGERSLVDHELPASVVPARDGDAATIRVTGDGSLIRDSDLAITSALIAAPKATLALAEALLSLLALLTLGLLALTLLTATLAEALLSLLLAGRSVAPLTLP